MLTLLVVMLLLALLFGGWAYMPAQRTSYGYWGWSPLGLLLVVALVLWVTGYLH